VQAIDAEISRLEKIRALLTGHTVPLKRGMPSGESPRKRKRVSGEGRARTAEEEMGEGEEVLMEDKYKPPYTFSTHIGMACNGQVPLPIKRSPKARHI
jgi:hypothetical protein